MTAGAARIKVTFQVDADGLLSVGAREQSTGIEATVTVKPSYGLSDDDIARMLQESFAHADEDVSVRALAEQRVEAERIIDATQGALARDGDLLAPHEIDAIRASVDEVRRLAQGEDHHALAAAIAALNTATGHFAELRMDRSVAQALTGRSVDALS
jgi:molecular chaperone HscA